MKHRLSFVPRPLVVSLLGLLGATLPVTASPVTSPYFQNFHESL